MATAMQYPDRMEMLGKENYETWKIHMESVLVVHDAWDYVSGRKPKPRENDDAGTLEAIRAWERDDQKAKAKILLAIKPTELKQVKDCVTSRDVWIKLKSIYQSSGPARKATMLRQLARHKMSDGEDARDHLRKFFDTTDKLREMDVNIPLDLLSVLLLNSLPQTYENFRCAIESRDELPSPDTLRVKIIEEYEARKDETRESMSRAMLVKKTNNKHREAGQEGENEPKGVSVRGNKGKRERPKIKCYRCGKIGHMAKECKASRKDIDDGDYARNTSLNASAETMGANFADAKESWCLDSGCTTHMGNDKVQFVKMRESPDGRVKLAGEGATAPIRGKGHVQIIADVQGRAEGFEVTDALRVPDLRTNLLSVGKIADRGYRVIFDKVKAVVIDERNRTILTAHRKDGLYYLRNAKTGNSQTVNIASDNSSEFEKWHRKMGHLNARDLVECCRNKRVRGMKLDGDNEKFACEVCIRGKMTRTPFPTSEPRNTEILEVIHSDLCGPMRVESNGKARYIVTFIDDCSRWCEIRLLRRKDEVLNAFKDFKMAAENRHGKKIQLLQTDNGKEFCNDAFDRFLKQSGIRRRLTVTHTPEQNGIAERKNRTLLDMTRCFLIESNLPASFWGEAVNTANYIRNRCPSRSIKGITPFERWTGRVPDVSHLQPFGTSVYTLDRSPTKSKLQPRSRKGVLVGYSEESKGYRIWLTEERKVDIARDVKFLPNAPNESNGEPYIELLETRDDSEDEETVEDVVTFPPPIKSPDDDAAVNDQGGNIRRGGDAEQDQNEARRGRGRPRLVRTGSRGRPRKEYQVSGVANAAEEELFLAEVPLREAMSGSNSGEWLKAIVAELKSVLKNDTWVLTSRPSKGRVIGSRIVLRNKYRSDGTIERRKARIVARGFAQRPGIDFKESFAPVARMGSIRSILAVAAENEMTVSHFDVTTAFLNGVLDEEVFMELPEYTAEALHEIVRVSPPDDAIRRKAEGMLAEISRGDKACLLRKALYGLRQAGRCWNERIDKELRNFGARRSSFDSCVYTKGSGDDLVIIAVYVDDILVASRNAGQIEEFGDQLRSRFDITSRGTVEHCLGMEFSIKKGEISVRQSAYIRDVLERFGMSDARPVSTPMDSGASLKVASDGAGSKDAELPYRELVGALMYLSVGTRPDISFVVSHLSQFCNGYGREHWTAAKRVLRYLRGTIDLGLTYRKAGRPVTGYVDADWGNCTMDRRSYTGYAFILAGCPVTWESRKQRTVALSSTEAEYMALSEASKEGLHLRRFLKDLGFEHLSYICIRCDNHGARKLAENPVFHGRTKHIDVRHHFVRDVLRSGELDIKYSPSCEMAADVLTKGLPRVRHYGCLKLLGIVQGTDVTNEESPNRVGVSELA